MKGHNLHSPRAIRIAGDKVSGRVYSRRPGIDGDKDARGKKKKKKNRLDKWRQRREVGWEGKNRSVPGLGGDASMRATLTPHVVERNHEGLGGGLATGEVECGQSPPCVKTREAKIRWKNAQWHN
ncbi:conserved hypothetical protein [Coccidioides posadasii str. Silveira]|uniref:Uncharacterized protein n=1 Tax=Coccidioides posadasii (strain RMSCC 757 / Silveira) TaxID=443226 RepID=E9CXD1_COCPS|nr:conserved hypothetical protein [Coccidioides posadasii str. Silveira]